MKLKGISLKDGWYDLAGVSMHRGVDMRLKTAADEALLEMVRKRQKTGAL
ncbi:MAG: hypothetical protein J0M04_15985 [Verrucomicrobia bacterium]|nr:hypothetical protein [Verrucomicrobiota bacterium]